MCKYLFVFERYHRPIFLQTEDELLYLDPHVCQPHEDFETSVDADESYHCQYKCRMSIDKLDPSIALVRLGPEQ